MTNNKKPARVKFSKTGARMRPMPPVPETPETRQYAKDVKAGLLKLAQYQAEAMTHDPTDEWCHCRQCCCANQICSHMDGED